MPYEKKTVNKKQYKHAYLIIAHHRPDLLQELLEALDDPRNDIFLHIDKKAAKDMDFNNFNTQNAGLDFVPSLNVNWGGYSQIECTMRLLYAATKAGPYKYYHLATGATYPLKSNDYICDFFDEIDGQNLIEIDGSLCEERVKFYWFLNEYGKGIEHKKLLWWIRYCFIKAQELFAVDRFKKYNMTVQKGFAYWHVTHELAEYVVKNRQLVKDIFKHSVCGDEQFMQTLAFNSSFKDTIYGFDGKTSRSKWLFTWLIEDKGKVRTGHNFKMYDLNYILESDALFAMKFEGDEGMEIIQTIKEEIGKGRRDV